MTNSLLPGFSSNLEPPENLCVVRVKTSCWNNNKGIYTTKSITYQKRKSYGYGLKDEEELHWDKQDVFDRIVNLHEVPDGLYEVRFIDIERDPYTNWIEDCNFQLIPYEGS